MYSMDFSIVEFIKKYKVIAIILIPLLLFFAMVISLFPEQKNEKSSQSSIIVTPITSPTPTPFVDFGEDSDFFEAEIDEPLENDPNFLKREPAKGALSDGTVVYTFASTNPARPNIIITQGKEIIFQRTVIDLAYPVAISDYTDVDGSPDKLVQGPRFYGFDKMTNIYEKKGVAFIADPQTQQVLEQHLFTPMPADEYIKMHMR